MRQNFGIGIGLEIRVAVLDELFLQRLIILDHAVVYQGDFAGSVKMGMGVLVVNFPVRSPTRVTDPVGTGGRLLTDQFRQRRDSSSTFARFNVIAIDDGNPGRVVTAIFESPQPIEQDGSSLGLANITDDSAHIEGWKITV